MYVKKKIVKAADAIEQNILAISMILGAKSTQVTDHVKSTW